MIAECWKSSSVLLNGGAEELFSILGNFCGKGLEGEIKIDLSGFCDSLPLFQFTHLHEVRPPAWGAGHTSANFNSRTYTRCDIRSFKGYLLTYDFNSRTYTRCDPLAQNRPSGRAISIHAPTRGATRFRM